MNQVVISSDCSVSTKGKHLKIWWRHTGKAKRVKTECTTGGCLSRHHVPPSYYENTVLRWLASPTFSKNMKSCKETKKGGITHLQRGATTTRGKKVRLMCLTIRKQAPKSTAFILTSMSSGNWMPKLSVSVKTSFRMPLHCLLMRPMGLSLSFPFSCRAKGNVDC